MKELDTKGHIVDFHLYEISGIGKFTEAADQWLTMTQERGMGVTADWSKGSFLGWWKCFKISGDCCKTLWIIVKTTELYNLKECILWHMNYMSKLLLKKTLADEHLIDFDDSEH